MKKIQGRGELFPYDKDNMNENRYVGIPNIDYTREKTCINIKVSSTNSSRTKLFSPRNPTD